MNPYSEPDNADSKNIDDPHEQQLREEIIETMQSMENKMRDIEYYEARMKKCEAEIVMLLELKEKIQNRDRECTMQ